MQKLKEVFFRKALTIVAIFYS